jgi:tellurite resistance protein TerC
METPIFLILFIVFILFLLVLDLGVFHRNDKNISIQNAIVWTIIWFSIALLFGVLVWQQLGTEKAVSYYLGYLMEKALSADNIFVMVLIFSTFGIEEKYYHRILFYGIIGAIVFRFIFIFVAAALIQRFEWVLIIFGAVLIYSAVKMFIERNQIAAIDLEKNKLIRFFNKRGWVTTEVKNHKFFTKINGKLFITPLFLVLLMIEMADLIFAVDSIPAVFAITTDPYIVFYSNIFAILGLRSLFFIISHIMNRFTQLKYVLMLLLLSIGVKMIVAYFF